MNENNCGKIGEKTKNFLKDHRYEIASIILSFVVLSYALSLRFTVIIFVLLIIHEGGHIWALIKKSIGVKRVYFFIIGGGVSPNRELRTCDEAAFVALMGSVFTTVMIIMLSLAWYIFDVRLFANMAISFSAITLFNLLPYALLDGGMVRNAIWKSNKFGHAMFLIPEIIILSFIVFKSKIILFAFVLMLLDMWLRHKTSNIEASQDQNGEGDKDKDKEHGTMISMTAKEVRSYYVVYFVIVAICIIVSLAFELSGFALDVNTNFETLTNSTKY